MAVEIKLFDNLRDVASDARGALSRSRQKRLFDRLEWFELTARLSPPRGDLLAIRADDGRARMWLFLADRGRGHGEAFATWYTLGFAPIFAGAASQAAKIALAAACARKLRSRFASLILAPLSDEDRALLEPAFAGAGWSVAATPATANWVAHTNSMDADRYWEARPSRLRNTLRRKQRAQELAIEVHERFSSRAWADYEAVYRASWKPNEGSPAFLRALAQGEGAAGTLRLGIARSVGQPVAAQLWHVENGVATIHKLAHVEAAREGSPGTILSEAMFRHVIEQDQPNLIDFGTGDDAYKADWMDERRTLWWLEMYNHRSLLGLARSSRRRLGQLVRRGSSL